MTAYLIYLCVLMVMLVIDVLTDLHYRKAKLMRPEPQEGFSPEEYDAYMGCDFDEWMSQLDQENSFLKELDNEMYTY